MKRTPFDMFDDVLEKFEADMERYPATHVRRVVRLDTIAAILCAKVPDDWYEGSGNEYSDWENEMLTAIRYVMTHSRGTNAA